ncbi:NADP-dependent oxidoreductase domain [Pseudocohnilembus persalinus]|uniref:NADP-dependent oxidoreductase domain n=1 Tax=Pseudocohnilembus persalinus TaxID=266149 RepID=A0A0V0R305_PSEPJ|nr:NADP-dependent oxidoreductase domain [Pseudocohnilembus persalinus]|eukprot:KRX08568.1 NADP-dependent oxidoreductase domain [Pseudocohnilembus persalinus]
MQQITCPLQKLSNGIQIPTAGLGLYKSNAEDMQKLLQSAIEVGYRHFDTAILYNNEEIIGDAFEKIFKENIIKREEVFITSKVFPNHGNVIENVKNSLKKLKLNYIDLYLLHWPSVAPGPNNQIVHRPVHQLWEELQQCVDQGLVKSIGVSNYNVQLLFDLLSYARIKPVMNQVELHVFLQQPDLIKFCKQFDVAVTAYCPLGRGGDMLQDKTLVKIAQKYNKSVAQIMLHHLNVNLGVIVIPKTEKIERLRENFDWRDFKMDQEDIDTLIKLDRNERIVDPRTREFLGYLPLFH